MLEFCTYIHNTAPEGHARLEIRIQAIGGFGKGPKGEMFVTPPLLTDAEVDHWVDGIIERLEAIRKETKAKLEEND